MTLCVCVTSTTFGLSTHCKPGCVLLEELRGCRQDKVCSLIFRAGPYLVYLDLY